MSSVIDAAGDAPELPSSGQKAGLEERGGIRTVLLLSMTFTHDIIGLPAGLL
jgi:hypothetical protein